MTLRTTAIKERVASLLRKYDADTIPVDVQALAKHLNIRVVAQPLEETTSGVLIIRNGQAIIGVNASHHLHRQCFTIAHELGHFLLHGNSSNFFVDATLKFYRDENSADGSYTQEIEANAFAAELLMPEGLLLQYLNDQRIELDDKASRKVAASAFGVSEQALTLRLVNLGLLAPQGEATS